MGTKPEFCVIVVDKGTSAARPSKELYKACSDKGMSDAQAKLQSPEAKSSLAQAGAAAATSTPLVRWWQDYGYTGSSTIIYGAYGTCDTAGYYLVPNSWWQLNLSSMQGYGQCNFSTIHAKNSSYYTQYALPVWYVGSILNDNVGSMQVYLQ
ncbi:MAG: hypothetical protein LLG14_24925 [Nocardiaceae bacterium]|nr:hypothetical protein [Nocardiaceae bacterium]